MQVSYAQDTAADAAREQDTSWQAAQPVVRHLGQPVCSQMVLRQASLASCGTSNTLLLLQHRPGRAQREMAVGFCNGGIEDNERGMGPHRHACWMLTACAT